MEYDVDERGRAGPIWYINAAAQTLSKCFKPFLGYRYTLSAIKNCNLLYYGSACEFT